MLIKLLEYERENYREKVCLKYERLKVITKSHLKEKREKDKKTLRDQKKFKECGITSNLVNTELSKDSLSRGGAVW